MTTVPFGVNVPLVLVCERHNVWGTGEHPWCFVCVAEDGTPPTASEPSTTPPGTAA
jgi:hypothetical protein